MLWCFSNLKRLIMQFTYVHLKIVNTDLHIANTNYIMMIVCLGKLYKNVTNIF